MGKAQVMLDYEGRVHCPQHGALSPAQAYQPGRAECGCTFEAGAHGMILARRVETLLANPQSTLHQTVIE